MFDGTPGYGGEDGSGYQVEAHPKKRVSRHILELGCGTCPPVIVTGGHVVPLIVKRSDLSDEPVRTRAVTWNRLLHYFLNMGELRFTTAHSHLVAN